MDLRSVLPAVLLALLLSLFCSPTLAAPPPPMSMMPPPAAVTTGSAPTGSFNISNLKPCSVCPGWPQPVTILGGTCTPMCTTTCCQMTWDVKTNYASSVKSSTPCYVNCNAAPRARSPYTAAVLVALLVSGFVAFAGWLL